MALFRFTFSAFSPYYVPLQVIMSDLELRKLSTICRSERGSEYDCLICESNTWKWDCEANGTYGSFGTVFCFKYLDFFSDQRQLKFFRPIKLAELKRSQRKGTEDLKAELSWNMSPKTTGWSGGHPHFLSYGAVIFRPFIIMIGITPHCMLRRKRNRFPIFHDVDQSVGEKEREDIFTRRMTTLPIWHFFLALFGTHRNARMKAKNPI